MIVKISDSQKVPLSIVVKDKKDNVVVPAAGSISYLVDNPAVVALTPSADGATCDAAAAGPLGTATVTGKVALANGNQAVGTIEIEVDAGDAATVEVVAGAPVEQ